MPPPIVDLHTFLLFVGCMISLSAITIGALHWMLSYKDAANNELTKRLDHLQDIVTAFHEKVPVEYVRREDWIRFSATIDGKLDRLRDDMESKLDDVNRGITELTGRK